MKKALLAAFAAFAASSALGDGPTHDIGNPNRGRTVDIWRVESITVHPSNGVVDVSIEGNGQGVFMKGYLKPENPHSPETFEAANTCLKLAIVAKVKGLGMSFYIYQDSEDDLTGRVTACTLK